MPRRLRYLLPSQIGTSSAKNIPQCPALLYNLNGNGNFPLRTDSMNINTKTQTLKYLRSTFDLLVIGCLRGNITKIKWVQFLYSFKETRRIRNIFSKNMCFNNLLKNGLFFFQINNLVFNTRYYVHV